MYNDNSQQQPLYREEDELHLHFAELESHSDTHHFPASSSQIHPLPHPYPLFSRQENMNSASNRSLDPHSLTSHHSVHSSPSSFATLQHQSHPASHESAHGWPSYQQRVSQTFSQSSSSAVPVSYSSQAFPSPSPFPPARLSPPPVHQAAHYKGRDAASSFTNGGLNGSSSGVSNSRLTLAGSLDPATGIFYRTPEHPRLRTAQACEKCRTRKAKCSGEHPSCKRCITRGLICEYAKEGRVRGPNKPKPTKTVIAVPTGAGLVHGPSLISGLDISSGSSASGSGQASRNRTSSIHSSSSSEHLGSEMPKAGSATSPTRGGLSSDSHSYTSMNVLSTSDVSSYRSTVRRNSLSFSESRMSMPRPPDLQLNAAKCLRRTICEEIGVPEFRNDPCTADPYFIYQQRYQEHQDQREVFAEIPLDPIQPAPIECQPQHQLHRLPQRPASSSSRELPQIQNDSEYPLGLLDQAGNVLMQSVQNQALSNYTVEDAVTYLPPPETFVAHQTHMQTYQTQIPQEQRTYEQSVGHRASRWSETSSEVFHSSRTMATSRATPPSSAMTHSSCLSSAHMSMTGNAGMDAPTSTFASGRLMSSSASASSGGAAAALGGGGRARMLMTDYSRGHHQAVLPPHVQTSTELQYALEPVLRDPPQGGILVNIAEGRVVDLPHDRFIHGHGNSQDV